MAHILIVDDDPHIIQQLTVLTHSFGCTPLSTLYPDYLFEILGSEPIDLILLDVHMPGTDGVELLKQLKKHPIYQRIPVIMLTGDTNIKLLAKCFQGGATDFINKPIKEVILQSRVESALKMQEYVKKLEELTLQLQDELKLAEKVQRATIHSQIDLPFLESGKLYLPYGQVSGDIYDLSLTRNQSLNVFLGDATGHGVSAALITMMVKMGLNTINSELSTNKVVHQLNQLLSTCIPLNMFVASIFMRITQDGMMSCCNGGIPPIIIIPANQEKPVVISGTGIILGVKKSVRYSENTYQLNPGDKIFVYTDGITECLREEEPFGISRLAEFLEKNASYEVDTILNNLLKHLTSFTEGQEFKDDITMLAFEYKLPE